MVMSPAELGTMNGYAGEAQQQFTTQPAVQGSAVSGLLRKNND
jgi:hypothetical protein